MYIGKPKKIIEVVPLPQAVPDDAPERPVAPSEPTPVPAAPKPAREPLVPA